jgi:hypothetical protein
MEEHDQEVVGKLALKLQSHEQLLNNVSETCGPKLPAFTAVFEKEKMETELLNQIMSRLADIEKLSEQQSAQERMESRLASLPNIDEELSELHSLSMMTLIASLILELLLCVSICVLKEKEYFRRLEAMKKQMIGNEERD